jgi:hypothetical protein
MAKSNPRNGVKNSQRIRLFSLALIVATAVAYLPAWNGKPIWDDNAHITQPELRSWHGLVEVWTPGWSDPTILSAGSQRLLGSSKNFGAIRCSVITYATFGFISSNFFGRSN